MNVFKESVNPKIENAIYSPSCHFKTVEVRPIQYFNLYANLSGTSETSFFILKILKRKKKAHFKYPDDSLLYLKKLKCGMLYTKCTHLSESVPYLVKGEGLPDLGDKITS